MTRLTRHEKAVTVGAGLLLGAAVASITQLLGLGWPLSVALCVIGAAGAGAGLASGKHGIW